MAVELDQETDLPLGLLYKHSQNPKKDIHGIYRNGLKLSIEEWGDDNLALDDRLKVFPDPSTPGKYVIINGNQRFDVLVEMHRDRLVKQHFNLSSDCKHSEITKIINNSENADKLRQIHSEIMQIKVPVQIKTLRSKSEKFTQNDAKSYVMTYDRNHAQFDEGKQALLYRELASASERAKYFLDHVARPERAFVVPTRPNAEQPQLTSSSGLPEHQINQEGEDYFDEFGPIPQENLNDAQSKASLEHGDAQSSEGLEDSKELQSFKNQNQTLIPMVFSFTAEGFKEIDERILRLKARMFREKRLISALERLEKIIQSGQNPLQEMPLNDIVCEVALRVLDAHIEIADAQAPQGLEQNGEKSDGKSARKRRSKADMGA